MDPMVKAAASVVPLEPVLAEPPQPSGQVTTTGAERPKPITPRHEKPIRAARTPHPTLAALCLVAIIFVVLTGLAYCAYATSK